MTIETVGPGGISAAFGIRSTTQPTMIGEAGVSKPLYNGFAKESVQLSNNYTIQEGDDGVEFICTTALTITVPALDVNPSFWVDAPPSGSVTITPSGGATLNGSATSLTRTRAANPAGVTLIGRSSNDYGVSGV